MHFSDGTEAPTALPAPVMVVARQRAHAGRSGLSVTAPAELVDELDRLAAEAGVTRAKYVVDRLAEFVAERRGDR